MAVCYRHLSFLLLLCLLSFGDARRTLDPSRSRQLQSSDCSASTLAGYKYSYVLQDGLLLHWTPYPKSISFAMEAKPNSGAESGWLGIGWSPDGTMLASDSVIGNLPGNQVQTWYLADYTQDTFTSENLVLGRYGSRMAANGTIMWFSRLYNDGQVPIPTSGTSSVIYAYSADNTQTFDYHDGNYGTAYIDFNCGNSLPSSTPSPPTTVTPSPPAGTTSPPPPRTHPPTVPPSPSTTTGEAAPPSGCTTSSLPNYSCMLDLSGSDFVLHWKLNGSTSISFAADVATTGWVSVGWSSNGKMSNSDAAVGNLPAGSISNGASVGAYYMGSYAMSSIVETTDFSLTSTAVVASNGRTVIKFTRSLSDGAVPMTTNGANTIIWAYSPSGSQNFAFHGKNNGAATIDFSSGQSTVSSSANLDVYFFWHGLLLAVSFCVLMPAAIIIARVFLADVPRNQLPSKVPDSGPLDPDTPTTPPCCPPPFLVSMLKNPWEHRDFWFAMHKYLQMFAVLTALVGFIIPFCVTASRGLEFTHGQLGLAVMIMFFFQPIIGFMRPDRGTPARSLWFATHWCVGISCVVLGWLNTFFGLDLYASEFLTGVQAYVAVTAVFISIFASCYCGVILWDMYTKRKLVKYHDSSIDLRSQASVAA